MFHLRSPDTGTTGMWVPQARARAASAAPSASILLATMAAGRSPNPGRCALSSNWRRVTCWRGRGCDRSTTKRRLLHLSMCLKKACPRPMFRCAPSTKPGMSATTQVGGRGQWVGRVGVGGAGYFHTHLLSGSHSRTPPPPRGV